jgi:hypothetical protein
MFYFGLKAITSALPLTMLAVVQTYYSAFKWNGNVLEATAQRHFTAQP